MQGARAADQNRHLRGSECHQLRFVHQQLRRGSLESLAFCLVNQPAVISSLNTRHTRPWLSGLSNLVSLRSSLRASTYATVSQGVPQPYKVRVNSRRSLLSHIVVELASEKKRRPRDRTTANGEPCRCLAPATGNGGLSVGVMPQHASVVPGRQSSNRLAGALVREPESTGALKLSYSLRTTSKLMPTFRSVPCGPLDSFPDQVSTDARPPRLSLRRHT